MTLPIELEQEDDGRWFGIVDGLPGVMAYGATREQAATATRTLALRVPADRIENGEEFPPSPARLHGHSIMNWPSSKAKQVFAALKRIFEAERSAPKTSRRG
jgi:predicted RNase H-like HicB family nuclease